MAIGCVSGLAKSLVADSMAEDKALRTKLIRTVKQLCVVQRLSKDASSQRRLAKSLQVALEDLQPCVRRLNGSGGDGAGDDEMKRALGELESLAGAVEGR